MNNQPAETKRAETAVLDSHPTRIRWWIMTLTTFTTAVTIFGRANLGILARYVQDEFAFDTQTMGWIFSAFVFAYHPFQFLGGWAGDRYGPRKVMTFSILWWSVFTVAIAFEPRLPLNRWLGLAWSFAILRFLIGLGEAPTSPNLGKIVALWMGKVHRGVGASFHVVGIGLGGSLAPVLLTWVAQHWGWRAGVSVPSVLGVLVAISWWYFATDRPDQHPGVNADELAFFRPAVAQNVAAKGDDAGPRRRPPWGRMLSSVSVWAMLLSYFCQGYTPYIFVTWFFIYLVRVRHLTMMQGGMWGSTPFIAIMLLAPLGGWLSDRAVAKFGKRRGRRSTVWLGMGSSAILLWAGGHALNNTTAILMLAASAGLNYSAVPSWWATCIDIIPNYSGSLIGVLQTAAGGWLAPIMTAYLATHFGWTRALDFAALLTALAAFLWIFVNADENLEDIPVPSDAAQYAGGRC
jgi:ACS family glucarate transporter-like MFS transporter